MTSLNVPNTVVNGTIADATDVQGNFDAIESHVNTEMVNRDGSVAMTGELLLPSNPTSNLGAATKSYVDGEVTTLETALDTRVTALENTDIDVELTGNVTGSGTVTNLGDVSFATTIADDAVTSVKIADDAVTGAKIADNSVAYAQLVADLQNRFPRGELTSVVVNVPSSDTGDKSRASFTAVHPGGGDRMLMFWIAIDDQSRWAWKTNSGNTIIRTDESYNGGSYLAGYMRMYLWSSTETFHFWNISTQSFGSTGRAAIYDMGMYSV